ncbi:MAG: transposase [Burkholderia sp.]
MAEVHYSKPWIVHFAQPSSSRVRNVNYLGQYIKRPRAGAQSRLKHDDGKTVRSTT